jgi:hypothetical protein
MTIPPPWYCWLIYALFIYGLVLIELERKPAPERLKYKDLNA